MGINFAKIFINLTSWNAFHINISRKTPAYSTRLLSVRIFFTFATLQYLRTKSYSKLPNKLLDSFSITTEFLCNTKENIKSTLTQLPKFIIFIRLVNIPVVILSSFLLNISAPYLPHYNKYVREQASADAGVFIATSSTHSPNVYQVNP